MTTGDKIALAIGGFAVVCIGTAIAVPNSITTEGERIAEHKAEVRKQHRTQRMSAAVGDYINKLSFSRSNYELRCVHSTEADSISDYDYICRARDAKTHAVERSKFGLTVPDDGAGTIEVARTDEEP